VRQGMRWVFGVRGRFRQLVTSQSTAGPGHPTGRSPNWAFQSGCHQAAGGVAWVMFHTPSCFDVAPYTQVTQVSDEPPCRCRPSRAITCDVGTWARRHVDT
jgi:hypothetical protein